MEFFLLGEICNLSLLSFFYFLFSSSSVKEEREKRGREDLVGKKKCKVVSGENLIPVVALVFG